MVREMKSKAATLFVLVFPIIASAHHSRAEYSGEPIEFDAIDERPVDLVFLLLAPDSAGADHLKALALVSRLLRDERVCARLRGADNAEALYAVLTDAAGASRS